MNQPHPESITCLLAEHRDSMLSRARRLLRSQADAEDVVQEVMLAVLRGPHLLAGVERVLGWLLTLVQRRAVDLARREARRRRAEADEDLAGLLYPEDAEDPEASEEAVRVIAAALQELPPEQAEAFVANVLEGATFREMAARSGTPAGTLMARKKRAADHIRARLREHGFRVPTGDRQERTS
ncbi:MAG: sigma-70 family RNA polymerase sigma factor [Gemmatimonadota bacterium]